MVAFKKTWWWKWDSSSRRVEWSKNPNENDDLFSRTKIYQKVFVGTHFLILIFDFKLKGLSKMTDRFCEGKKIHHQQQQQHHYHYWYLICWSNKTENPFNQKRREDQALKKLKLLWVIGFERGCSFKRVQSQQCSV